MNKRTVLVGLITIGQVTSSCTHAPTSTTTAATTTPVAYTAEQRAPSSNQADTPWTTWSEKGKIGGLIVLKNIRENLLKNNLHDPHINYSGYSPIDCSKRNTMARSADGTCTDVNNAYVGASGVAFGRNVSPEFVDKNASKNLMTPNPAVVSKEFFTRDEFKPVPFLNMIAGVWIQFMNHDWMTHGANMEGNPYKVQVPGAADRNVDRTKENLNSPNQYKSEFGKVTINEATHWWDGSQIYGSNQETQNTLRSFSRGKLKTVVVDGHELLPKDEKLDVAHNRQNRGLEMTGFRDNWWVGLSMLHNLFVKEHNAIADMLMKKNVKYNEKAKVFAWINGKEVKFLDEKGLDEQIFQTARLISAAVLAKIHTVEWTPAILPNDTLRFAMYTNWYGSINPKSWSKYLGKLPIFNKTDWFKNTKSGYMIGGVVGDKTDNFGVPFSITEEFTSVYRLHSLLPEVLNFKTLDSKARTVGSVEAVPFNETRNEKTYEIMSKHNLKDLYYSFGTQHPGQLVLNNFPNFMQNLAIPGHDNLDMGMVDIIRDRERGVPRYNQFRRAISLKPIASYKDFFPAGKELDARQLAIVDKFNRIYGKDSTGKDNVEMIDLLVGTLAEEVRPKNFGFGETQFQIFILMASRRLMADRFFTSNFTEQYYTKAGLSWIDNEGTLAQVITRHMPELAPKMKGLDTAFQPWKD